MAILSDNTTQSLPGDNTMGRAHTARAKKQQAKYSEKQRAELREAIREIGESVTKYGGQAIAADLLYHTGVVSKHAAACLKSSAITLISEGLISFSDSYGRLRELGKKTMALEKRMGYKSDLHHRSEWHPAIEASYREWEDEADRITTEVAKRYGDPAMIEAMASGGEDKQFGIDAALEALSAVCPAKEVNEDDTPPVEEIRKLFPSDMNYRVNEVIEFEIKCSIDSVLERLNKKPLSKHLRQVIWDEMTDYVLRFWWQRRNEAIWQTINAAAEAAVKEARKRVIN